MVRLASFVALTAMSITAGGLSLAAKADGDATSKPNIIFILTDDQDSQMDSLDYMPHLKNHMMDKGVTYKHHYCTVALCCPARATIWTGLHAHNTNVTDLKPPYGGYPKFVNQGFNDDYLPIWLQKHGYNTYYVGKFLNSHGVKNYNRPCSKGWTGSEFLLDPHTYNYKHPKMSRNCGPVRDYKGHYNTDLVAKKSFGFLKQAIKKEKPFFLTIAPVAPHNDIHGGKSYPPIPAKKYRHKFPDAKVPRRANFNPDKASGASWIKTLEKLDNDSVKTNDRFYRRRLQALQSVDEMIDELFARLKKHKLLDNTYIFYSADNGFHISQHRMQPGKTCGYEEDINVPLIIRGPGLPKGTVSNAVTAHVDLAPTFARLAGVPGRKQTDGSPIHIPGKTKAIKQEHANIEFWSLKAPPHEHLGRVDNTYKALRLIGDGYSLYYSVWCNHDHELYDMTNDPHQMKNLFASGFKHNTETSDITSTTLGVTDHKLATRLDGLMFVLKSCKGHTCRKPWNALMPGSKVSTLKQALHPKYDGFFSKLPNVHYTKCEKGHLVSSEGPQFQHWKKTHDLEGMGLKQVVSNDTSWISDDQGEDGTDDSDWIEDDDDWLTTNDNTEWVDNSKAKASDPEDKENEARDESNDSDEEDLLDGFMEGSETWEAEDELDGIPDDTQDLGATGGDPAWAMWT
ncbi:hypothetical protein FDECE_8302 [Fusarium decemcellulare]|nr:hypothetical protein FDECE_8302 [Fusarium decemcellulare]